MTKEKLINLQKEKEEKLEGIEAWIEDLDDQIESIMRYKNTDKLTKNEIEQLKFKFLVRDYFNNKKHEVINELLQLRKDLNSIAIKECLKELED